MLSFLPKSTLKLSQKDEKMNVLTVHVICTVQISQFPRCKPTSKDFEVEGNTTRGTTATGGPPARRISVHSTRVLSPRPVGVFWEMHCSIWWFIKQHWLRQNLARSKKWEDTLLSPRSVLRLATVQAVDDPRPAGEMCSGNIASGHG